MTSQRPKSGRLTIAVNCVFCVACLQVAGGCSPQNAPAALNVARTEDTNAHVLDYPEFAHWNQFSVGTQVVAQSEITGPKGATLQTTTIRLVSKTDEALTLENKFRSLAPMRLSIIRRLSFRYERRCGPMAQQKN